MEPGLIVAIVLVTAFVAGGFINLVLRDRSGALDDDRSGPMPFGQSRPKGPDSGQRLTTDRPQAAAT